MVLEVEIFRPLKTPKPYFKMIYSSKHLVVRPFEPFGGHSGPLWQKFQVRGGVKLTPKKSRQISGHIILNIYNHISKKIN